MAKNSGRGNVSIAVRMAILLSFFLVVPGVGWSQSPFYQGKTIRIIHGRNAGGSGDLRVRAMVPFLQKYIPGNPTIIHEFMPGGGAGWIDPRQQRWWHGGQRGAR